MNAPKLTPWFPGSVKPVRVGVYERDYNDGCTTPAYCRWDGEYWRSSGFTADQASVARFVSLAGPLPWRGLAEEPKQ